MYRICSDTLYNQSDDGKFSEGLPQVWRIAEEHGKKIAGDTVTEQEPPPPPTQNPSEGGAPLETPQSVTTDGDPNVSEPDSVTVTDADNNVRKWVTTSVCDPPHSHSGPQVTAWRFIDYRRRHLTAACHEREPLRFIDYFRAVWPQTHMADMIAYNNANGHATWKENPASMDELEKYIGVFIVVSRHPFDNRRDCWAAPPEYVPECFHNVLPGEYSSIGDRLGMSRLRFEDYFLRFRWSRIDTDAAPSQSHSQSLQSVIYYTITGTYHVSHLE